MTMLTMTVHATAPLPCLLTYFGYVKAVERCHELQRHVALLADQDGRHVPSDTGVKTRDIGVMTR